MQTITTMVDGSTSLPASQFNQIPDELEHLITTAGIILSGSNLYQAAQAVATYCTSGDYYDDIGAVNAIQLQADGTKQYPRDNLIGTRVRFKPANDNTATSVTVQLGTLTALNVSEVQLANGETPVVGDDFFKTDKYYNLIIDQTPDTLTTYWRPDGASLSGLSNGTAEILDTIAGTEYKLLFSTSYLSYINQDVANRINTYGKDGFYHRYDDVYIYVAEGEIISEDSSANDIKTLIGSNGVTVSQLSGGGSAPAIETHPKGVSFSNCATNMDAVGNYRINTSTLTGLTFAQSGDFPWAWYITSAAIVLGIPWSSSNRIYGASLRLKDSTNPSDVKFRVTPATILVKESALSSIEIDQIHLVSVLDPFDVSMSVQEIVLHFDGTDIY